MVNDELRFTEILEDVKFSARSNGGYIKEEDVREAFEELDLSKEQFSMVFDYLRKNNIGIGEPLSDEEYLNPEERNILEEYDRELGALQTINPRYVCQHSLLCWRTTPVKFANLTFFEQF